MTEELWNKITELIEEIEIASETRKDAIVNLENTMLRLLERQTELRCLEDTTSV